MAHGVSLGSRAILTTIQTIQAPHHYPPNMDSVMTSAHTVLPHRCKATAGFFLTSIFAVYRVKPDERGVGGVGLSEHALCVSVGARCEGAGNIARHEYSLSALGLLGRVDHESNSGSLSC